MKKEKIFRLSFLIIFGIYIFLTFAGIITEGLFTFNVLQTDQANVRTFTPITFLLTLAILVVSSIVWYNFFKKKPNLLKSWNILTIILIVTILYKLIEPTILVALLNPVVYQIIFIPITILIWYYVKTRIEKYN